MKAEILLVSAINFNVFYNYFFPRVFATKICIIESNMYFTRCKKKKYIYIKNTYFVHRTNFFFTNDILSTQYCYAQKKNFKKCEKNTKKTAVTRSFEKYTYIVRAMFVGCFSTNTVNHFRSTRPYLFVSYARLNQLRGLY